MRLINANKLEKALETEVTIMGKCANAIGIEDDKCTQMVMQSYEDIIGKIKEEQTIEAIPVEWLENFLKEEYNKGFESDGLLVAYGMIILCKWREEQGSK